MSLKSLLHELNAVSSSRKIDTVKTVKWARATYRLSREIEIAGFLCDTKFLLGCGLTRTQIRNIRLFSERLDDQVLLEQLLQWLMENNHGRQLSRTDVLMELCCTGKPIGSQFFPGAHWQSVGHWGRDGHCYYDIAGPAL